MPIDFTRIESGEEFELLCEDLLQAMGFAIEAKVARGPDLGKDIIATQTVSDRAGFSETHRYLIERAGGWPANGSRAVGAGCYWAAPSSTIGGTPAPRSATGPPRPPLRVPRRAGGCGGGSFLSPL